MLSIKNNVENTIVINKSTFITNLFKVSSIDEINNYIETIKSKYKDATHNCYAYILENTKRFNDDGEPNGTAGKPILDALEKNNLNYVLCIVTRYFGGIKLGAGGLVRAYSKSTSECIRKSKMVELVNGKNVNITFNYDMENKINSIIDQNNIKNKTFENKITYNVSVLDSDIELLKNIADVEIIKDSYIEKDI
jgi:uncharacterized YigZ family protein